MIKKFVLVLCIIAFSIIPVSASNWMYIGNNKYIDTTSISKYNQIYGQNNIYSVWIKEFDVASYEKILGKKILFLITLDLINCQTKEINPKSTTVYDNQYKVIVSYKFNDYETGWTSIIPDSIAETEYNYVCFGK